MQSRAFRQRLMFLATLFLFGVALIVGMRNERLILAATPGLGVRQMENGALVFVWRGEVAPGMAQKFADAFDAAKGRTDRIVIDLSSPGGLLAEGDHVVRIVRAASREFAIETHVGRGARCMSMCVPIYLAGETRTAAPSALFMFHEPSTYDVVGDRRVPLPEGEQRMISDRFFARYFDRSDMDPTWRENLRRVWRGREIFKTARQLVDEKANIVETLGSPYRD